MSDTRLVYSTDGSNDCPACGKPLRKCRCQKSARGARPADGIVRIRRESKGRAGKEVTVIDGLDMNPKALRKLASSLKTHCGSGGSVKGQHIEIQGDHRDKVAELLRQAGHECRLAGG